MQLFYKYNVVLFQLHIYKYILLWLLTYLLTCLLKPKFHLARHVSTQHDTYDVSRRACRAVLFDKLDTAKMHGLDASNVSCRAET